MDTFILISWEFLLFFNEKHGIITMNTRRRLFKIAIFFSQ